MVCAVNYPINKTAFDDKTYLRMWEIFSWNQIAKQYLNILKLAFKQSWVCYMSSYDLLTLAYVEYISLAIISDLIRYGILCLNHGTTIHSILTFSIKKHCIKRLFVTFSINNKEHINALPLFWVTLCWLSRFSYCNAKWHYGDCRCSECHLAVCHYAEFLAWRPNHIAK
jgi:hypothetical protein